MHRKKNPSAFIRSTHEILQREDLSDIIGWAEDGHGFLIKDLQKFESQILPQYFKHKKYTSFVRQVIISWLFLLGLYQQDIVQNLNMYGFHKQRHANSQNYFKHQQFKKGQILLAEIKRKPQKKKMFNNPSNPTINNSEQLSNEIQEQSKSSQQNHQLISIAELLMRQNQMLIKMNNSIRNSALQIKDLKIQQLKSQELNDEETDRRLKGIEKSKMKLLDRLSKAMSHQKLFDSVDIKEEDNS